MGSRNADRIPLSDRYLLGRNVVDMYERRWEVISHCLACGLNMAVDLRLVARVSGPATSLWNRTARCRRIGCAGRVEFQAKAPGMTGYEPLRTHDQPDRPGWAQQQLAKRAAAEAAEHAARRRGPSPAGGHDDA